MRLDKEAMACTGGAGLLTKSFIVAACCGDEQLLSCPDQEELGDVNIDDEMCAGPNVLVLLLVVAANCGISSN